MSNITEVAESAFEAEVLKADVPVVVDFWAPWCGPCRMMVPVFEKVAETMAGRVKFVKMNTDENFELSQKHRIMAIPSLLVFHKGQEVQRSVGFLKEKELEAMLEKILGGVKPEAPKPSA